MANLYDLELQESNNFVYLLIQNGESPSLKLLRDQKEMSAAMGPVGEEIVKSLEDPTSEIGKSFKRLNDLEHDVQDIMQKSGMTTELAKSASDIFKHTPSSLGDLNDKERSNLKDYWIKKKTCISMLIQRGYSYPELFS